jgi:hypothetical protein
MANNKAITIFRGDTSFVDVAAKGVDDEPLDLTNCLVWFTLKRSLSDSDEDALIAKTLIDGITVTNALEGLATVQIDPEDTDSLTVPILGAYYDVQIRDSLDNIFTISQGTMNIVSDVTRSNS